jgi:hypothetical protein
VFDFFEILISSIGYFLQKALVAAPLVEFHTIVSSGAVGG